MKRAVLDSSEQYDVIIKAAAVSDYRPREKAAHKIKKQKEVQSIELVKNPDITEDLLANATEKLRRKNLDMIVANDVSRDDAGFESDTNQVKVISRDGHIEEFPLMTKEEVADQLLDRIKGLWEERSLDR
jgi:phosphopantothenoylcysteine decarboxylase/phosphopantothenate--cysteine ligase